MQDQEHAAAWPGKAIAGSAAACSAEQVPSTLSPGHDGVEAHLVPVEAPSLERTQHMQAPKQASAGSPTALQGIEQMSGQALSLSVEGVHALGTELCSKVGLCR